MRKVHILNINYVLRLSYYIVLIHMALKYVCF